jgi:hypothetical protein
MSLNNEEFQEEGPEIEQELEPVESVPEPIMPEPEVFEPVEEVKPPSRFQRILRRILIWALGLLGVFAVGVAVTWITQIRPLQSDKQDLMDEIEAVKTQAEADIAAIEADFESKLEAKQAELDEAALHTNLLSALVDVSSARVALGLEDTLGARSALAGLDDRLTELQQELGGDSSAAVMGLREQLASVLAGMADDPLEADSDLASMTDNLLRLERSIFGD